MYGSGEMRLRYRFKMVLIAIIVTAMGAVASPATRAGATPDFDPPPPGNSMRQTVIADPIPASSTTLPPRRIQLRKTANLIGLLDQGSAFPDPRDLNLATASAPHKLLPRDADASLAADASNDRAAVPLPSPAWSGLSILALLGLFGSRKAIVRFLT
jgi:hypothetical protein